jgi:hypothetical protein
VRNPPFLVAMESGAILCAMFKITNNIYPTFLAIYGALAFGQNFAGTNPLNNSDILKLCETYGFLFGSNNSSNNFFLNFLCHFLNTQIFHFSITFKRLFSIFPVLLFNHIIFSQQ